MPILFFVTILFDEVRLKVLCIHTRLIILCRRLRAVIKRERLLVVYMFQHTCAVLNILFHWFPLICTSIVFRDGGIVMWQSLLFFQLIKNNLSNSCRIAHMFAVFASEARTVKMFYFARL